MRESLAMVRFENLFLLYAATALTWKPALLSFIDAIFIHVLNRGSYLKLKGSVSYSEILRFASFDPL